jgi:hypothetical protein
MSLIKVGVKLISTFPIIEKNNVFNMKFEIRERKLIACYDIMSYTVMQNIYEVLSV